MNVFVPPTAHQAFQPSPPCALKASQLSHACFWMSWLGPLSLYVLGKFSLLFMGDPMYRHDAFKHLSFFAYFIDNFQGVVPPTWSPFTHSGEPFFLYIPINGLLHPAAIISVLVHRLFPELPFVTLNTWEIFAAFVFYALGCHLLFSRFCRNGFALTMANTAIIFGTTGLAMWQQLQGALDVIEFLPWILLCTHWAFTDQQWHRLIYAGIFLGAAVCTYIPVFVLFYLAIMLLFGSVELMCRKQWPQFANSRRFMFFVLVAGGVTVVTALPALALLLENANLIPVARLDNHSNVVAAGVQLSASDQWVGSSYSTVVDLQTPILPMLIVNSLTSEVAPYVGVIPFCLAALGLLAVRRRGCPTILCGTLVLVLTALGPLTPLASWLRQVVPGFSFVRHVFMFAPFIAFNLALLSLYGAETLFKGRAAPGKAEEKSAPWSRLALAPLFGVLVCLPTFMGVSAALSGRTVLALVLGVCLVWLVSIARYGVGTAAAVLLLLLTWIEDLSVHALSQKIFTAPAAAGFTKISSTNFHYNQSRLLAAQPVLPPDYAGLLYADECVSMGEPLLFSVDTAFFADNLRYFMLRNYYEFTGGVFNATEVTPPLIEKLGLGRPKLELTPSEAGSLAITGYHPNSIALDLALHSPANLLYRNVDDGHWQLTVDGKRQALRLQDKVFPTVELAAGRHALSLQHRPWLFLTGFYSLVLGYLVLLLAGGAALVRGASCWGGASDLTTKRA